ncbi:carboxylesterase family protein [Rhodococcus ruber]|uniref:Carboxylic ester hydrolase n=1 Tax=Rhodococcus ruber TaxID=1830 RepID=A0A098BQ86_9NOCA|nr:MULTISPECIES: carboxylesterase family protein [Rhodococcus]MCD2125649.1 carboxylesterase family protein [Rhodococcus ruber]MCZ1070374.1 carboxylesterase family protein [Rhodococcus sp. A5(2022)]MCZ4501786.1 carboxylesterase family protein [Rhodococcus ruber]MCZ4529161.1 carboxylesterase family protein [Rhodococcus ruber]MCZ4618888.1 carboxylesterase family protein [Rhodococcus ruber]
MTDTVQTGAGAVRGTVVDGVWAFLGIPYAAAPVGPARFAAPAPVPRWEGARDATVPGPTCPQSPYAAPAAALLGNVIEPGDECLNLSVWTPDPGASALPVMVWIHGGAFTRGSNRIESYDGRAFARDGVVLVSVNYRLGVPGFLSLDGAPDNRGLLDQIAALRWVQDNIRAFGGDPGNVTVFGESAGGMSVAALLASPAATGLFHRAVVQSGNATAAADVEDARRVTAVLAGNLGVPATAAAFGALDPGRLQSAQDDLGLELAQNPDPARWGASVVQRGLGVMSLFPTIDGEVLPSLPIDALAAGAGTDVPVLAGTTTDEFRFFLVPTGIAAVITGDTLPFVLHRYGIDPAIAALYAGHRPGASPGDVLAAILTDYAFRSGTVALADAIVRGGGTARLYEFAWPSPVQDLRACHALEIAFVFDRLDVAHRLTGDRPPQSLADEMHRAWVQFATTGDPGWAPVGASRPVRVFGGEGDPVVVNPRSDELACWIG